MTFVALGWEGHLQPELVKPGLPAVHLVGRVGQTEVDHGDTCPRTPGARQGGAQTGLLELPNHLSQRPLPAPSLHKYLRATGEVLS